MQVNDVYSRIERDEALDPFDIDFNQRLYAAGNRSNEAKLNDVLWLMPPLEEPAEREQGGGHGFDVDWSSVFNFFGGLLLILLCTGVSVGAVIVVCILAYNLVYNLLIATGYWVLGVIVLFFVIVRGSNSS